MVLKRKGYNEKLNELRKKSQAKEQAVNYRLNAFRGIEQVFTGQITGEQETAKSFAEKIRKIEEKTRRGEKLERSEMQARMNSRILTGYLELLGYDEILRKKGLEKALQQFFMERNWKRKQK